jgi:hypothetical protein
MGIVGGLRRILRARTQNEIELDYLNQSVSHTDLERRQREIDRGYLRQRRINY